MFFHQISAKELINWGGAVLVILANQLAFAWIWIQKVIMIPLLMIFFDISLTSKQV